MKLIVSFILFSVFQLANSLTILPTKEGDRCGHNPCLNVAICGDLTSIYNSCPKGTSCVSNSTSSKGPKFCLKPAELGKDCILSYGRFTGYLDCAPGLFCKRDCVRCTKDMRPHAGLCVKSQSANETTTTSTYKTVTAKSTESTKVNPSNTNQIQTTRTYLSNASKSKVTKATRTKKTKVTNATRTKKTKVTIATKTKRTKVTNATRTKKTKVTNATKTKKTKVTNATKTKVTNATKTKVTNATKTKKSIVTNATRTKKTKVTNATRTKKSKSTRTDVSKATIVSNSIQKYDSKVTDYIDSALPSDVDMTITSSGMSLSLTGLVGFLIFSVL